MTREDAIAHGKEQLEVFGGEHHEFIKMAVEALEAERWIPISEKLPEEKQSVLVWCPKYQNIYCAYLEKEQWWIFGAFNQVVPTEVIAWKDTGNTPTIIEADKTEDLDNLDSMLEHLWNATVEDHRKYSEDMESEDKNDN